MQTATPYLNKKDDSIIVMVSLNNKAYFKCRACSTIQIENEINKRNACYITKRRWQSPKLIEIGKDKQNNKVSQEIHGSFICSKCVDNKSKDPCPYKILFKCKLCGSILEFEKDAPNMPVFKETVRQLHCSPLILRKQTHIVENEVLCSGCLDKKKRKSKNITYW